MTAPNETRPKIYIRPSSLDLGEMPIDSDVAIRARAGLTPRELGVWFSLNLHLWTYGELPANRRRLAAIGGVTTRAFEGMIPALAPLFDHDVHDRWGDADLVEKRRLQLNLAPDDHVSFEPEAVPAREARDALLSEKRRQAGLRGSQKRWSGGRRARLQLLEGGLQASEESQVLPSGPMTNLPSENSKSGMVTDADLLSVTANPAIGSPHADGLTDCLIQQENQTVSPSDSPSQDDARARALDGKTDSKMTGAGDGKTAAPGHGKMPPEADGKTPSDRAIADVVQRAVTKGGGHLDPAWKSTKCLETLRAAFADGCDLVRHYEPALLAFTQRATDKRIRHPANDPIMRAAWDLCVRGRQDGRGGAPLKRPDLSRMSDRDRGIHAALEVSLGLDAYVSWCGTLTIAGITGNVATLTVGTRFVRDYLDKTFGPQIQKAVRQMAPHVTRVVLATPVHGSGPAG